MRDRRQTTIVTTMSIVEQRLQAAGLTLPTLPPAAGAYVAAVRSGRLIYISGQLPRDASGAPAPIGVVGADIDVPTAHAAARSCGLYILAALAATVDLDRISRCVRLGGFVRCLPDFTQQPQVINGASELMLLAFGEAGKHARAAVGVNALPMGVAVEAEALFEEAA